MPNKAHARFALVALFAGAAGIGFAPIFVRLSPVGPSATAFYRLALAIPALWIWMKMEASSDAPSVRPTTRAHFGALALAGFFFAGDLAFWHWALRLTSVADATLLANCAPIVVTIGAHFLFGEKIALRFIAGMIVAMLGMVLVVGASFQHGPAHLLGNICGLITPVFYGAYMLSLKNLRGTFSTATIMSWSGLFACPILLVVALVSGESFLVPTLSGWAVLVALGLVSHAGGQSLIAFAFAHLSASFSSVGLLLQPVIAVFLAWIILSESLTSLQATGGIVVLAGIALAKRVR